MILLMSDLYDNVDYNDLNFEYIGPTKTPKQMLQRLPIALAKVKAGNNSESLLNEIKQIIYFLYQSKQITTNVYNHLIESIQ